MRKQYYSLRDMYRLKGGFLKKSPQLLEIFFDQKKVFDKYLCVPDYSFLWDSKYYGVFTDLSGHPMNPEYDDIDKIVQGIINKHFNGKEIEYSARTMLTEMKLPKLDMSVLTYGIHKQIEEVEDNLDGHRSFISQCERSIEDRYDLARSDIDKLESLYADMDAKGDEENARLECERINKSIASITRSGFWHFAFCHSKQYVFVSEEVEMTDPNGLTVNFGQYVLELNMSPKTFVVSMRVYKFRNNFNAHSYYHCNISSWGDICWGNMGSKVADLRAQHDVCGAVDILNTILTKYTPTSPYMRFNTFRLYDNKGSRSTKFEDKLTDISAFLPLVLTPREEKETILNEQTLEYLFPESWPKYLEENAKTEEVSDED